MKLFTSDQIRKIEAKAEESGVSLVTLMENAGAALALHASDEVHLGGRITILCGNGNNGGDGFVCAARLAALSFYVTVILTSGPPKADLAKNAYTRMPISISVIDADQRPDEALIAIAHSELIIDAIFGFGFHGELKGTELELVRQANKQSCYKISADLPSGVECNTGAVHSDAFRASKTVSFTAAKYAHVLFPGREYCGKTVFADIGIPETIVHSQKSNCELTDKSFVKANLPPINPQSNKGENGRLMMVCGSYGMIGACIMAAKSALRTGIGLLDIAIDKELYPIIAPAIPEAVFTVFNIDSGRKTIERTLSSSLEKADALLIGCGLGNYSDKLCPIVFSCCNIPMVIDADGLNYLSRNPDVADKLSSPRIFTPHPGEMSRLCGSAISDIQKNRIGTASAYAKKSGAVTILKGAGTVIADPEGKIFINSTGNEGLAKGGSGDCLAGITAALLAQSRKTMVSAVLGAYIHGMAGDICKTLYSKRAMLPTDLPAALSDVFGSLEG